MKKKIIILFVIISLFLILAYLLIINKSEEYVPEEEIAIADAKTVATAVFFQNKDTKEIEAEMQNIDIKEMLQDPYNAILNRFLNGPKSDNLEKVIPEEIKIDSVELENCILKIEMSSEKMIEDEKLKTKIKESIEKTLTQLNEISKVEIKINGVEI